MMIRVTTVSGQKMRKTWDKSLQQIKIDQRKIHHESRFLAEWATHGFHTCSYINLAEGKLWWQRQWKQTNGGLQKRKVLFMVFHPNAFGLYERKIYKTCVRVCVCVNLRVSIIRSMIIHSRPLSLSSFVSHYEYNPFSSITYHPWIIASSPHLQALLEQKSGVPSQIMTICYWNKWYPP